jgi:hypothetical protein
MAQQMIKRAIERLLKEVNEPLTTTEILGRLSDRRYKNVPSVNSIGQILSRDKRFVKVTFYKKVKQIAWTTKEETQ